MSKDLQASEEKNSRINKPARETSDETLKDGNQGNPPLADLQQMVGNQAVQRLLAQRAGDEASELDEETETRINTARQGGQPLDEPVQEQMSSSFGVDFSGVRAHTSGESDNLNQQLGSKAFTTGQDIFFREGAYDPNSSGGKELIAHELTHVVQQSSGAVSSGGGGMQVNPPGDAFEQEADAVAKTALEEEPEKTVQRQELPEEEELQMKPVQRQEEEELQMQHEEEEEEEMLQPQRLQRQEEEEVMMQLEDEEEEEEMLQPQRLQRQEEEEELQMQPMEEEEEMLQPKRNNS